MLIENVLLLQQADEKDGGKLSLSSVKTGIFCKD